MGRVMHLLLLVILNGKRKASLASGNILIP